jgi:carbon monoxide dehydrogenase subunit G
VELTHDFVVPAPIETAWATFMDLERVGGCFPGASVTDATGESFAGTVKVKLGPIALVYAGAGSFLERDDASHRAVIEAKGKDKRGNGTAGATVTLQLAPANGGAATRVDVTTELAITGKPAQFGRGVMQDVSDKLLQQFVACIESQFDAPDETAGAAAGAAGAPASERSPSSASSEVVGQAADAPEVMAHGEPLPQYRAEVADGEGMALSPAEIADGEGMALAPAGLADGGGAPSGGEPVASASGASSAPSAPRHTASVAAAAPTARPRPPVSDDAVDLGATVLPVILKAYAPRAVGALVAIALGYFLGRRSRR